MLVEAAAAATPRKAGRRTPCRQDARSRRYMRSRGSVSVSWGEEAVERWRSWWAERTGSVELLGGGGERVDQHTCGAGGKAFARRRNGTGNDEFSRLANGVEKGGVWHVHSARRRSRGRAGADWLRAVAIMLAARTIGAQQVAEVTEDISSKR